MAIFNSKTEEENKTETTATEVQESSATSADLFGSGCR
jgi:hypothetical protein